MAFGFYPRLNTVKASVFFDIMQGKKEEKELFSFPVPNKMAKMAWANLYREYVREFGAPEIFLSYLREGLTIAHYYTKSFEQKPYIGIARAKLAGLNEKMKRLEEVENQNVYEMAAIISQNVGFRVNPDEMSAKEFLSYLKRSKEANE